MVLLCGIGIVLVIVILGIVVAVSTIHIKGGEDISDDEMTGGVESTKIPRRR